MRRPLVVLVLGALMAAVIATSAAAATKASTKQRRAVAAAIRHEGIAPSDRSLITNVRVSSVSKAWAYARIQARPAFRASFQDGYAVLVQPAGKSTWTLVDYGSAQVGCGIAPDAVIADLLGAGAGSTPCPPDESAG